MIVRDEPGESVGSISNRVEALTAQFYDWERRGRGWTLWDQPVTLEPPFRQFWGHCPNGHLTVTDDARKPTIWSAAIDGLRGLFRSTTPATKYVPSDDTEQLPSAIEGLEPLHEIQIAVPPDCEIHADMAERFLLTLGGASRTIGFEILARPEEIITQWACASSDLPLLEQQLRAHFPEVGQATAHGYLERFWHAGKGAASLVVDFGLAYEFMRPLGMVDCFRSDPLVGLLGAVSQLEAGEFAAVQFLFEAARHPWASSMRRAVTDGNGRSFFVDAPELVRSTQRKCERPLFAVVMRLAVQAPVEARAWQLARMLGATLGQLNAPNSNELMPLHNEGYPHNVHEQAFIQRQSYRSGMLLNSEELVSFVHLPSAAVNCPKLLRRSRKTKTAPITARGNSLVLGQNEHAGRAVTIGLTIEQRLRHAYLIGASGTGKSTLLLHMMLQDLQAGTGFALLDPHGDLVDHILERMPPERCDDVIVFDPADEDSPVGFNVLGARSAVEKTLLASDLVAAFRRLATSWGDQMTSVLTNAVLAYLESDVGGTLADLRRFLIESDYRREFLKTVSDPEVVYYWQKEFPLLAGRPQASILSRLDAFLRSKPVRHIVNQRDARLDLGAVMQEGTIFLARLSQGAIGEENAHLLGTLLVAKFHQMALARQSISESQRRPFYLYIDEFHNFLTPSLASILAGTRKYGLGLILAHQELRQLGARDGEVLHSVLANPGTRVCFRVGDDDARRLADGFASFDAMDLQNLGRGEAIVRLDQAQHDFNLSVPAPPAVDLTNGRQIRERVIAASRSRYGTPIVTPNVEPQVPEIAMPAIPPTPSPRLAPKLVRPAPHDSTVRASGPTRNNGATGKRPPMMLGRGGPQHQYLQHLIKRWAEVRGYRATIEQPILDGLGKIDVALEREGRAVACEISVTSTPEQELGNVQKCLAAGWTTVVVVATDKKALAKLEERAWKALETQYRGRVLFQTPEELFAFLSSTSDAEDPQTVRGYRIKTEFHVGGNGAGASTRQAVTGVILKAMRRLKGADGNGKDEAS